MSNTYNKYFAKDKPLRHYTQHLLVAITGYVILGFFKTNLNIHDFVIFIMVTYLVDLDGLISVFIFREKIKEAGQIVKALKEFKFIESSTLATMHHKKLNRLIVHNVIGLIILSIILIWSIYANEHGVLLICWAIFCHFIFDILDDIYQLGHINNWLWPLKF